MKHWYILLGLVVVVVTLTACGGAAATETDESAAAHYEGDVLGASYEGALDVSAQLALGTLMLEETDQAVTSSQAKTLLPLWRALQGGVTAEGEIKAVLRGIEGAMNEQQLASIADMQLTQEDMQSWMEEQRMGAPGGFPGASDLSDEQLEAAQATRQAAVGGEGGPRREMPSGEEMRPGMATRIVELGRMSEEEREAMMATAQAGDGMVAGFRGGAGDGPGAASGGIGQLRGLLRLLIIMLETRID